MDADFSQFQQVFFDESNELINAAEQVLLKIDLSNVGQADIDAIFRCAHCIKSSSGMFGFTIITQFAHILEEYLDKVRNKEKSLSRESVDVLLESLDCMRGMILDLQNKKMLNESSTKVLTEQIDTLIQGKEIERSLTHKEVVVTEQNTPTKTASSIRVATEKVDALIDMVGELVITQSMLAQICNHLDIENLTQLKEGFAHLEQNCRELQSSVMRIRMLPVSNVFNRFPRMVRELCHSMDKQVTLKMTGENTEVDKGILEKISDPLIHLIRNALDHGIEPPQERLEKNKSEVAQLHLDARHQGSTIVIEIRDDGRGLDLDKIKAKALSRELIQLDEVLSQEQINDLIFTPGFSTAEQVTDISGRGVGLDVVRKNIETLGGRVEVTSTQGQGCKFTIILPLTMAIIDGQLIRIGNSVYVIPLVDMIETIQLDDSQVHRLTSNTQVYALRDEFVPIIRLGELFENAGSEVKNKRPLLVIIKTEKQTYGLLIDELLQMQQVVIKSMEKNYGRIEGFSGATILGDGTVALILDTIGIIRAAGRSNLIASLPDVATIKTVA